MEHKKLGDKFVLKLEVGDEIITCLEDFCKKHDITAGAFFGVGATNNARIAYFDREKEEYIPKELDDDSYEITSLKGNIAVKDNEVIIHSHIVLGDRECKAHTGHLKHAKISVTGEIVVIPMTGKLERTPQDFGLDLLSLR